MTVYYAMTLSEQLRSDISTLLTNLDQPGSAPQHALHTQISIAMADEILENLLMSLINAMKHNGEGAGILGTLANLIKGTVHVLIRQLLGKHDNAEVSKMAQYLRDKSLLLNGESRFGFAMPEPLGQTMMDLLAKIDAGEGVAHKADMTRAMLTFTDMAIDRFYDDFVAPMELGFIKRKAVDIGRSTIHKGAHAAIGKLFPQLGEAELRNFAEIYRQKFVQA